jgi:hypothetical protein
MKLHTHYHRGNWRLWWGQPKLLEVDFNGIGLAVRLVRHDTDDGYASNSLNLHLGWPSIYLTLPWRSPEVPSGEMGKYWGFCFFEQSVHLNWGDKTRIVYMPWSWATRISNEVQRADGSWAPYVPTYGVFNRATNTWEQQEPDGRHEMVLPYTYKLRSGELQVVSATIYVERSVWRRRWLKWTRFLQRVDYGISITFSAEVGERAGSWKGGVLGCGYSMRPGESPEQTLRRMERERKFN